MFHVGQKVVCIDANGMKELVFEGTYTIYVIAPPDKYGQLGLGLEEATPNDPTHVFLATRFIPLSDWQEAEEAVKELTEEFRHRELTKELWKLQEYLDHEQSRPNR